jgi:hypothetical protein
MLEIILVWSISKKIAAMMKEKGRSAAGYVILFIALWFGGEIIGGVIGFMISLANNPNAMQQDFNFVAYGIGLLGAVIGGVTGYAIAASMPALEDPRRHLVDEFDDEEEDDYERERARRRQRRDAEDGAIEERGDRVKTKKKEEGDGAFEGRDRP